MIRKWEYDHIPAELPGPFLGKDRGVLSHYIISAHFRVRFNPRVGGPRVLGECWPVHRERGILGRFIGNQPTTDYPFVPSVGI